MANSSINILILHLTYAENYIHYIHHSTDLKKNTHKRKVFIAMKRSMNEDFLGGFNLPVFIMCRVMNSQTMKARQKHVISEVSDSHFFFPMTHILITFHKLLNKISQLNSCVNQ